MGRNTAILAIASVPFASACGGGGGGGDLGVPLGSSDAPLAGHVLNRAAYGPTPDLLSQLGDGGPPAIDAWLAQQLDPATIDESGNVTLNNLLATIPVPASEYDLSSLQDLSRYQVVRALYSERQLQEQLTDFWENHFHTQFLKTKGFFGGTEQTAAYLEFRENELLREGALGRFEDLLVTSATSPTMLIFLDSIVNVDTAPNENYARELVELHTMGVDNGYTEADIEEIARCFTGWTICLVDPGNEDDPHAPCNFGPGARWAFHFDPSIHDTGMKVIFPGQQHQIVMPPRVGTAGIQDGFDLLAHLAGLPQTARFVSTKLVAKFVDDATPTALVDACVAEWLATDGDIGAVVEVILTSDEFLDGDHTDTKVRTPLENLVSTVRAFDGVAADMTPVDDLIAHLQGTSQHILFQWPDPDGYPEEGDLQLGTSRFLDRTLWNMKLMELDPVGFDYDLPALLAASGVAGDDEDGIVAWLFDLLFQDQLTQAERDLAYEFLTTLPGGGSGPLDPGAPDYELRLGLFAAYVATFPQALQQ